MESASSVCRSPASRISARTRSAPTAAIAMSVAVLSLWVIMASSTLVAAVVPLRLRKTGLFSVRAVSLTASCLSRVSRPSSTSRR